jgi:hypothetical protein
MFWRNASRPQDNPQVHQRSQHPHFCPRSLQCCIPHRSRRCTRWSDGAGEKRESISRFGGGDGQRGGNSPSRSAYRQRLLLYRHGVDRSCEEGARWSVEAWLPGSGGAVRQSFCDRSCWIEVGGDLEGETYVKKTYFIVEDVRMHQSPSPTYCILFPSPFL